MPIRLMPRFASTENAPPLAAPLGAAIALALAAFAPTAAAQDLACDSTDMLMQSADAMRLALPRCQKNATYLARMGHLYLVEERYAEAADHLERALLFQPENAAAQLDYALALAGSGDLASALNLMLALQQRPDLPEPLRRSLRLATREWASSSGAAAQTAQATRIGAGLRMGYDSNLLGAPQLRNITLTLPGESITLPVDGSSQPHPGGYARADMRLEHTRLLEGNRRWDLQAAILQRSSPRVNDANSTQAELQLEHARSPTSPGALGYYASGALAVLRTHAGTRYASQGLAAGLQWAAAGSGGEPAGSAIPSTCAGRLGMEWQNRALQSNQVLSGRYSGISAHWGCSVPAGFQWQLAARAGRDQPRQASRPGGAQDQFSLRAYARGAVGGSGAWVVDTEASHSEDASGYSPLLDNGRRRRISRLSLRSEYQQQLAPGLVGLVGIESVAQRASLSLFSLRSQGVYLGLRAAW